MNDKLVIKAYKPKENGSTWKPLMVPSEIYDQVEALAEQAGMKKGYLAIKLLGYALDNVEIEEEED